MKNKVLTLIGFAKKCGKAFSGEEITLEKIKSKKAKIVFIASDASGNTAKRFSEGNVIERMSLEARLQASRELLDGLPQESEVPKARLTFRGRPVLG